MVDARDWFQTAPMTTIRSRHTLTVMGDGFPVAIGGWNSGGTCSRHRGAINRRYQWLSRDL